MGTPQISIPNMRKMPETVYKEKMITFQGKIHKDIAAGAQPQKACNRPGTEGGGQP